jgi:hypothetical protein
MSRQQFERDDDDLTLAVIAERLRSIRMLSETGFENIQRQLDGVRDLPVRVEHLAGRMSAVEARLEDIEGTGMRGIEFRRGTLPIILLTLALVMTSLGAVVTQLH